MVRVSAPFALPYKDGRFFEYHGTKRLGRRGWRRRRRWDDNIAAEAWVSCSVLHSPMVFKVNLSHTGLVQSARLVGSNHKPTAAVSVLNAPLHRTLQIEVLVGASSSWSVREKPKQKVNSSQG
jgi:hypothetical protein